MDGKVVIVTGGFGALGGAVAASFATHGAAVVRIDRAAAAGTPPAGCIDLGGVDITDPAAATTAVADCVKQFGGIDVLVNVAGGFVWQTVADSTAETWTGMYAMNMLTTLSMTKACLPHLLERPGARIINIGAAASAKAAAGMGAYAASKSAVSRFTESLAEELKTSDITVNAVLPSIIDTPANRASMPDADTSDWVQPEALAEIIVFLASPAAGVVSGALLPVTRALPS
jgi:NAD(P)-dependent dehydrogenase (short-subunit alcohol dehydrogenase family)